MVIGVGCCDMGPQALCGWPRALHRTLVRLRWWGPPGTGFGVPRVGPFDMRVCLLVYVLREFETPAMEPEYYVNS